MDDSQQFTGFLKFYGPFADEGSVDISKAGKSLVALDRFSKKYQKEILKLNNDQQIALKISGVNKNCSEIVIALSELIQSNAANFALISIGLERIGIAEFGKQFFGTLGAQLALMLFSKGKRMKEIDCKIEKNTPVIILQNMEGQTKKISIKDWGEYKQLNTYLAGIVQLEKGKEERMKIGYKIGDKIKDVAEIEYKEKDYFDSGEEFSIEERMKEPFDEESAKEEKIVGKFVDYYGLAHKYHFAFQARKKQDDFGKQKILCIVSQSLISRTLDYLKPENKGNVCICGKATRDWEGKVDKIKIEWINEDEDYNPHQTEIQ